MMARPIKDTPVLTGKDARRFAQAIKANESKTITREEYERILRARREFKFR